MEVVGKKLDTTQFFRTDPNSFAMKTVPLFMYSLKLDNQPITEEKIKNGLLKMALSGISANSFIDGVHTFLSNIKKGNEEMIKERQERFKRDVKEKASEINAKIKANLDAGGYKSGNPYVEWSNLLQLLFIFADENRHSKIHALEVEKIAGRILDGKPSGLLPSEEEAFKEWYAASAYRLGFEGDRVMRDPLLSMEEKEKKLRFIDIEFNNIDDRVKKQLALQFGETDPERIERLYQIMQQS